MINTITGSSRLSNAPERNHILYSFEEAMGPNGLEINDGTCPLAGKDGILTSPSVNFGAAHQHVIPIRYILTPAADRMCLTLTHCRHANSAPSNNGALEMTAPSSRLEEARRDDALAAESSKCLNVRLIVRRFPALTGAIVVADGTVNVWASPTAGTDTADSSIFCATSGITPLGKDAESEMGSSLHSGHISDPLP